MGDLCCDVAHELDKSGGSHESSKPGTNVCLGLRLAKVQFETILKNKVPNGNKKNIRVKSKL